MQVSQAIGEKEGYLLINNKTDADPLIRPSQSKGNLTRDTLFSPMLSTDSATGLVPDLGERGAAVKHPCRGALAGSGYRV